MLIMPSGWMRQPEVQSKVDVLGGPSVTAEEAVVQAEHRLNLARQIVKMATRIESIAGF